MTAPPHLSESLHEIIGDLRADPYSHQHLNRAAARIDQLGRRLHGLGYARDREIAASLTGAFHELSASQEVPQVERGRRVQHAIAHLQEAAAHADEGGAQP